MYNCGKWNRIILKATGLASNFNRQSSDTRRGLSLCGRLSICNPLKNRAYSESFLQHAYMWKDKVIGQTFVRLICLSANTASALKSCPGPSSSEKTILVWKNDHTTDQKGCHTARVGSRQLNWRWKRVCTMIHTLNGLSVRGMMGSRASIIKRVTLSLSS